MSPSSPAEPVRCPTPSCTATRTSRSWTAPPTPRKLAKEAARLGLEALALTDHDGFYGVVRFAERARAMASAIAEATRTVAQAKILL